MHVLPLAIICGETGEYVITENYFEKIDELIKEKGAIALRTAFNYVSDFVWAENGKDYLHTQHLTYVISEDQENYPPGLIPNEKG